MTDYTTLQADIDSWTARDDLTTALKESFTALAEDKIRRTVRVAEMRKTTTQEVETSSPNQPVVFTVNNKYLEPISLSSVSNADGTIATYDYVPPAVFERIQESRSDDRVFTVDTLPTELEAREYNSAVFGEADNPGLTGSKKFCMSFMVKWDTDVLDARAILSITNGGNEGFRVRADASGFFRILGTNAADTTILDVVSTAAPFVADTWYSVLVTCDMSDDIYVYIDGSLEGMTKTTFTDDTIDFNRSNIRVGADVDSSSILRHWGELAHLGFLAGTHLDVVSELSAIWQRFYDTNGAPVPAGNQAEKAFGTPADLWFPDGDAANNRGALEANFTTQFPLPRADTTNDFPTTASKVSFLVNPTLGAATKLKLKYYESFPRITSTLASHWLITNNYDLYLYGALAETYDYLQDDAMEQKYRGKMQGVIASLHQSNQRKLRGGGPNRRRQTGRTIP